MRGNVGVTQNVSLELQVAQTVLDHIADADEPASLPSRSTGMWRTRWCVMSFITRLTLSSGDTVIMPYCMISFTGIDAAASP